MVCRGEQAGLIRRDRYDVIRACHRDQVLGDGPLGVQASTMTTLPTGSTSATSAASSLISLSLIGDLALSEDNHPVVDGRAQ